MAKYEKISEAIVYEMRQARVTESLTISEVANRFNISKSTAQKYVGDLELDNGVIKAKRRAAAQKGNIKKTSQSIINVESYINSKAIPPIEESIPSYKKGFLGELYAEYRLLRHGLEVLHPSYLEPGCDLIVRGPSGKYYRCEVKSCSSDSMQVSFRNTKFISKGGYITESYENYDTDIFIAVILSTEELFILPREYVLSHPLLSFSPFAKNQQQFKDNFILFK